MRTVVLNEATKNDILENLLKRSPNSYGKFEASVAAILADVKEKKDEALFEYTKKFDGADIDASNIVVTKEEIDEAYSLVDEELVEVIRKALENAKITLEEKNEFYNMQDMYHFKLTGQTDSKKRRIILGKELGIGYGNANQMVSRLNNYGITKEEFIQAIQKIKEQLGD